MTRRRPTPIYLVVRVSYRAWRLDATVEYLANEADDGPSHQPVRAFAGKAAAERHRDELEREARATLPPVAFLEYEAPSDAEVDRLFGKFGLEPPDLGPPSGNRVGRLRRWWDQHAADLTPEQHLGLWALAPDVRFYKVVKVSLED